MGCGASKRVPDIMYQAQVRDVLSMNTDITKMHPLTYPQMAQACMSLHFLVPLRTKREVYDILLRMVGSAPHTSAHANEHIIRKGDNLSGIYVIRHGLVEMIHPDGKHTLFQAGQGNFFGELSAVFGVPAICAVRALTPCDLILLQKSDLHHELGPFKLDNKDLLSWCTKRGYTDTDNLFEPGLLASECTYTALIRAPLFHKWKKGVLADVACTSEPITYAPRTEICRRGDSGESAFFIIRGKVDVISDDDADVFAQLGDGVAFGLDGLFLGAKRRANFTTVDYCTLFELQREALMAVLESHEDERLQTMAMARQREVVWRQQNMELLDRYQGALSPEVLMERYSAYPPFRKCSPSFLHYLAHMTVAHEYEAEAVILSTGSAEHKASFALYILRGDVTVVDREGEPLNNLTDNCFLGMGSRLLKPGGQVRALQYTCAILLQRDAIEAAIKEFPAQEDLIDVKAGH